MIKKYFKSILGKLGYEVHKSKSVNYEKYYIDYSKKSLEEKRFINIGAGNFNHPYWTNLDYSSGWYKNMQKAPFINIDLTKKILRI
ncbi:MAG: hypothetical protein ACOC1K_01290 [Nanoarchaeota archaeon]